jgi:hypothetical protein
VKYWETLNITPCLKCNYSSCVAASHFCNQGCDLECSNQSGSHARSLFTSYFGQRYLSCEGLTYVWNDGAYSSAWCEVSPVQGYKVLACTHFYSHPGLLFMAGHSGNKCCWIICDNSRSFLCYWFLPLCWNILEHCQTATLFSSRVDITISGHFFGCLKLHWNLFQRCSSCPIISPFLM